MHIQLGWIKEALQCDTIVIHTPNFDCDIDGGCDSPTATD